MFAARGYVVAAVNFHGSTGYGQPFTNSITRNWGGLPVRRPDEGSRRRSRGCP